MSGSPRSCEACSKGINKLIDEAENESFSVCECCGSKEEVTSEGSWIRSLCKKCRIENEEEANLMKEVKE